jgi:hypothetical protein
VLSRAGLLHGSNWGAVFPSFACHFTFPLQFPP